MTQAKAVDLSRNFSINSVGLGSSPTRSPYSKRNLSGSSRTVRDHPGGGVQSQPPADMPRGTLGTWPLGRRRLLPQAASLRGCQNTNPVPVQRAFSEQGSSLTYQHFLLHVFPNLAEDLRSVCSYHFPFKDQALLSTADRAATVVVIAFMTEGVSVHHICSYLLQN